MRLFNLICYRLYRPNIGSGELWCLMDISTVVHAWGSANDMDDII